jgi:pimeloyl-ACP methyl ester carboxylesterase
VQGGVQGLIAEARRIGARGDDAVLFYRYATLIRQDETGVWRWKRDGRRPPDFADILSSLEALGEQAARFSWPVLLVRGGESRILSDAAAAEFVLKCPDARLVVVERAGRSVQEDNPCALAAALRAFWASLPGGARKT